MLYGSSEELTTTGAAWFGQSLDDVPGLAENDDLFGSALATGDFDMDGYDDLVVGVLSGDGSLIRGKGQRYLRLWQADC